MDQLAEEDIRSRYDDICAELNLDETAKTSAWEAYSGINNDYVLEVRMSEGPTGMNLTLGLD